MSANAAILKFFKLHLLPNHKLDWAKTWREAWECYRDSELLKLFHSDIHDGWGAILKFFKQHLLPNRKSDRAVNWWEPSERHRDSELLKSFRSDNQDGRHGGPVEILKATSPLKLCRIVILRYPLWPPWLPSRKSSNHICSWTLSWIEPKLGGRHLGGMEIYNC